MSIRVYSTNTCPHCKAAKDYLRERNLAFEDLDVGRDRQARDDMIRKSGQMGVPVIDVDGQIVVGFDRDRLDALLAKKA